MSNYNWCHGPNCHTKETQSRVRGSGDNKVLRTIRIKQGRYNWNNNNSITYDDYFCGQYCLMDYIREHLTSILAIAPRREALETPIKVEKIHHAAGENWRYSGDYTQTKITKVDNA
jgi:hypothetical protein